MPLTNPRREAAPNTPADQTAPRDWLIFTRPVAWALWAKNARPYLVGAAAGLVIARFAIPSLAAVLPEESVSHQALDSAANGIALVSILGAIAGLWSALHPTAAKAFTIALEAEKAGDAHCAADARAAAYSYLMAARWMADPERRRALQTKLLQLETGAAAGPSPVGVAAAPGATPASGAESPVSQTLLERMADGRRLSPQKAIALGRRIAEGLATAHAAGKVHGDLQPRNIQIGGDDHVQILGFAARQAATGVLVSGSARYISPEQAQGKPADARSDVYSFGIMLYHMLAGRPPYQGKDEDVIAQHLTERVPVLPDVPADLDALLHKCTHPEPGSRYQNGAALLNAFRRLQGEIA